jgi:iron uptake system EfeUOB component EfeO/EfeM
LTAVPPARLIEPVAEVFGDLDTQIDGRWQNPVTKKSQFMGFHRLEQILWDEPSLTGATALCQGLMDHEEKLVALVSKARYSPAGDGGRRHRPDQRGRDQQDHR